MDLELAAGESVVWSGTVSWRDALCDVWSIVTLGVFAYIQRKRFEYVVTTDRIHRSKGLFGKSSRTVHVDDVKEVNVSMTAIDRLMGVGDISFSSAGSDGPHIVFEGVDDPESLQSKYNEATVQ
jgi:uncharacterized membrane protein YdbT with pleckstrin-like domain